MSLLSGDAYGLCVDDSFIIEISMRKWHDYCFSIAIVTWSSQWPRTLSQTVTCWRRHSIDLGEIDSKWQRLNDAAVINVYFRQINNTN